MDYEMRVSIGGMGIVLFSAKTMSYVSEGIDFMMTAFMQAEDIAGHINKGDITGFCTGSGGDFDMHFLSGAPEAGFVICFG
jgi:hypothetical protein